MDLVALKKVLINALNLVGLFCVYVMIVNTLEVKLGFIRGAAAAQWQFVFIVLPVPFATGLITFLICVLSKPLLPRFYIVQSVVMLIMPFICVALAKYFPGELCWYLKDHFPEICC